MARDLCVLAVHAHPDDEATKGGATMASLTLRGIRTVLVTCTDGSAGEAPEWSRIDSRGLVALRSEELAESAGILGFDVVHQLGYLDSGMDGQVDGAYARLPLEPLASELAEVMRLEQPDVVVSYDPGYAAGHPDHARCCEVTVRAFMSWGGVGRPRKLYGTRTHSTARLRVMHEWLLAQGLPSPYGGPVAGSSDLLRSRVEVGASIRTARTALRAHRSQVQPDEPWFFAVPDDSIVELYPWEDFQLLATDAGSVQEPWTESDLLAGLS